jgi:radical SAM protein with 4Fe4S-binding SPASM domain
MLQGTKNTFFFLKFLTNKRLSNIIKILVGYFFSKWFGKNLQWGLPISIAIEPTTACNLRCPECPSGLRSFTRNTGNIEFSLFKKIIDELHTHIFYLTFYFQGEPYIHQKFLEMVAYASSKKIFTTTSTNAHFIDSETAKNTVLSGLNCLIISIDGVTQETYTQYRKGGELEKVIEGTKNILYWKKKLNSTYPLVYFQFLVVKPNEHEINKIKELSKELGVDKLLFKTAQFYSFENGNALMPANEKYSRYKKNKLEKYQLKNKLGNHCWKLWHSCVITWDGNVVPCCFDKDAKHVMGNIKKNKFENIWKNSLYQQFRSSLLRSRKDIDICKNCSEGTNIWA